VSAPLAHALLEALDEEALDQLAGLLAPRLAARSATTTEDGWLRGADRIAEYIDAPRSRVYSLMSAGRIPVHKDGSALVARKSELDAWVRAGGGKRP
jgi:excisionase family DNA binding protein